MEYVAVIAPVLRVLKVLHDTIEKHKGIKIKLKTGVRSLKNEMEQIGKDIKRYEEQELQELAYDIEDILPHLFKPGGLDFILTVLAMNRGTEKVGIIEYFKERIEKLEKRQQSQRGEAGGSTSGASGASRMNHHAELVGRAKNEFLELLSAADKGQMMVISIVGCSGLGKTALARALYDDPAFADEFDCKAWVVASECIDDAEGLLNKILQQISAESTASATTSHVRQPKIEELRVLLRNKRYLLVIDDMLEAQLWDDVKSAFPDTAGSRIIVTTSIQSIATYLSRGSHRYTMPCLDIDSSRNLLLREMYSPPAKPPPSIDEARILSKCDGLPLALVSVANHLRRDLTEHNCRDVGQALGAFIAGSAQAFGELKRALVQCYDSLPEYRDRRCLLSVSMFPQGHQINRKSLLRRWIAEGLVAGEGQRYDVDVASKTFREFVNRSIIYPVLLTGNNSEVKTCQVQGTMLEFIVHKSTCTTNFLTLIHKGDRLPKERGAHPLRRLSVHGDTKQSASFANKAAVSVIRWLAICGCSSIPFDLSKCRLLRVLDLEDCKELDDKLLSSICELVFLKYLSLRGSDVKEIPKKITELVNLETLDIRDTQVNKLPMEVIMMPGLVHLFGRFELLPKPKAFFQKVTRKLKEKSDEMEKFFSKKSKLQTLAGVDIDKEDQGIKEIMLHAKKLKKVKMWCKTTSRDLIPPERFTGSESLESLSVNSSDQPIDFLSNGFLDSLNGSCAIRSLKLRGVLGSLPDTLASFSKLDRLSELQLSSTGLSSEALSVLQKISCLLYLKLAEDRHDFGDGSFVVQQDGFPSLQRLCIKARGLPKVQLKNGAMPHLTSLELLICPGASLQTGATSKISSPRPEAPLQTGATSEITSPQPEAPPLQTGATSEITSPPPEAPLQTGATSEISSHQPEAPLQTGATSEITSPHPEAPPLQTGATSEIMSPQPEAPLQTGATSEISSHHPEAPLQTGANSEITSHQPEAPLQTRATSEITSHQPEAPLRIRATSEISSAQPEAPLQNGVISEIFSTQQEATLPTEATLKITSHQPKAPLQTETLKITSHQRKAPLPTGATLEISSAQPEAPLQTGATSEITSPQPEAPLQAGGTSEITSLQPETPLQTGATSEISSAQPEAPLHTRATAEIERHLGVDGILLLTNLNEVILHHYAPDATTEAWKEVAMRHINRPCVKKHPNRNSDTAEFVEGRPAHVT